MSFTEHILLIGPVGVGKTTIAEILSKRLGIDHINLDLVDDEEWESMGFDFMALWRIQLEGPVAELRYYRPVSMSLVEEIVSWGASSVIDCGGTHLVGTTSKERKAIKAKLRQLGIRWTAAIYPFKDIDASEEWFSQATPGHSTPPDSTTQYLNRKRPHADIANRTFYTEGGGLERVAEQILRWVQDS